MVAVQNDGPRRAEFHLPRRHEMDPDTSELARIQRRMIHFIALFQIFVQSRHAVCPFIMRKTDVPVCFTIAPFAVKHRKRRYNF